MPLKNHTSFLRRCACRHTRSHIAQQARFIRAFGYEQVKALAYTNHGEPDKVLHLHQYSISPSAISSSHDAASVIIRFLAAPINPADVNQIQGTYPSTPTFHPDLGASSPVAIPGSEGIAEVLSTGTHGSRSEDALGNPLCPGDWVIPARTNLGTWRTHALTPASELLKITDREGLTAPQVATATVNPLTAYRMLREFVALQPGDWFIQNAANSAVGRAAIQLGRLWGLRSINVVRRRGSADADDALEKELHVELGADVVIREDELAGKDAGERIAAYAGENGKVMPKLGLNAVGGQAVLDMSKQMGKGGHVVTYGAMGRRPITIPASMLIFKDLHYHGFWLSVSINADLLAKKKTLDEILNHIREKNLREAPMNHVKWDWGTKPESLIASVSDIWTPHRPKSIFIFGNT